MSLRRISIVLGLLLLGSTVSTRADLAESTVPGTLSLRTVRPAGAVFVSFSDGSTVRYLAGKAFTGHKPDETVDLSFQAPSGEGAIVVYFLNALNASPRAVIGRLKVNFLPASAPHLEVSETDEHLKVPVGQLTICLEHCEVRPLPASSAVSARSLSGATVPVTLTLSTPMPVGAVFIEWTGAEDARALVGRTFIDHLPTEPIELLFEVPVGAGAFKVSLASGDARSCHTSGPIRTTLGPGATPRLMAVEPAEKTGDEHPPMLQVSLEGDLGSP